MSSNSAYGKFSSSQALLREGGRVRLRGPLTGVTDEDEVWVAAAITQQPGAPGPDGAGRPSRSGPARATGVTCRGFQLLTAGSAALRSRTWQFEATVPDDQKMAEGWAQAKAYAIVFQANGEVTSYEWAEWVWLESPIDGHVPPTPAPTSAVPSGGPRSIMPVPGRAGASVASVRSELAAALSDPDIADWLAARSALPAAAGHLDVLGEPLTLGGRSGADVPFLANVQANILRPHVRTHLEVLLLAFDESGNENVAAAIAEVATAPHPGPGAFLVKSAGVHIDEVEAHDPAHPEPSVFVGVGLSARGYGRLGAPPPTENGAFNAGMAQSLGDPDGSSYEGGLDAIIIIGASEPKAAEDALAAVQEILERHRVTAQRQPPGATRRPFGFPDGVSQPIFITDDLGRSTPDGTSAWNPLAPLDDVLVREANPDTAGGPCFGSFLVFRTFREDAAAFDELTSLVEAGFDVKAAHAKAMLIGRFDDGTPLALQQTPSKPSPIPNNFSYADDGEGLKCPYLAHIRSANDRTCGPPLARRGQTYDAGLYFMAVVSDIESQFDDLQLRADGKVGATAFEKNRGIDVLIGRGEDGKTPAVTVRPEVTIAATEPAVTVVGGEYFFLPSIPFLRGLAPPA